MTTLPPVDGQRSGAGTTNCRRDRHYTYAEIQAQLLAMHLDDPKRLPKETMPTPESMVEDGWTKRCPNHPGKFIAGER